MRIQDGRKPVSVVLALLALALLGAPASASAAKEYTLSLDGSPPAVAGSTVTFLATFSVDAAQQQQLGSANLTPPAGFGLVSATVAGPATATIRGGSVELRSLALQPGAPPLTVSVTATVPCVPGPSSSWSAVAKQANDFNGQPGNNLTPAAGSSLATPVSGTCELRFVTEPAGADVGAVITGSAWNPAGPAVAVEVVDGAGERLTTWDEDVVLSKATGSASGTLTGGSAPTVSGLAEFRALRIGAPGWYRLSATSGSLTTAEPSAPFRIDTDGTLCLEDLVCSATAATGRSALTVTGLPNANADAGVLTLSFDAGLALNCPDYDEMTAGTALFEVTGDRSKTASLQIDKRAMAALPNNGASFLELCVGAPEPFTTKAGVLAGAAGTFDWNGDGVADPVYRGLLADCGVVAPPCVSKRQKTGAGDGLIQALLPPGDPGMRG